NSGSSDLTLDQTSSTFGSLTITGANVSVTENDAMDLAGAAISEAASFTSRNNAITDSGTLTIAGATMLNSGSSDLTLDQTSSTFGSLTITGANVSVTENAALDLASATISGTASFTSRDNAITDSGTLAITGAAMFNSGLADTTLDAAGSSFGALTLTGADVLVVEDAAMGLARVAVSGTASFVSTNHAIDDGGTLTIAGGANFDSGSADLTLDEVGSTFGSLTLTGADVSVVENDVMDLASATISGTASFTSRDNVIIDSGTLTITGATILNSGTADLTLDEPASSFGALTLTGADVLVVEDAAMDLAATSISGDLSATVTAGNLTDSGTVVVGGAASFETSADNATITLDSLAVTGAVSLTTSDISSGADAAATIVNTRALVLAASTVDGDLVATATTGSLTDSGTVAVSGAASFETSADNATITLDSLAVTGAVTLTTNGVSGQADAAATIVNTGALVLAASTVDGELSVTADSITSSGAVTAAGTIELTAGAEVRAEVAADSVVDVSSTVAGEVVLDGLGALTLENVEAADGPVTVIAAGAIEAKNVFAGSAVMDTESAVGRSVVLSTTDGGVMATSVRASDAVTIRADVGDITIGSVSAWVGAVNVEATTGSINDAGDDDIEDIRTGTLAGDEEAGRGTIILTAQDEVGGIVGVGQSTDAIGAIEFAAGSVVDVSSTGSGALVLRGLGALRISDGDTEDGSITVAAAGLLTASDVVASGADEDLALSTTTGNVVATLVRAASSVAITADTGSVVLGSVTGEAGAVVVEATSGSITSSGVVAAAGTIELTARAEVRAELAAGSVVDASSTVAGAIVLDGLGALTLEDVDTVDGLVTATAGGLLTASDVVASGADEDVTLISIDGGVVATSVSAADAVTIRADAGDIAIGSVSAGTGAVIVTATTGSINDAGDDSAEDIRTGILTGDEEAGRGKIILTAQNEVGGNVGAAQTTDAGGAIELAAGSVVDVSSTGSGALVLRGLGALRLSGVDTVDGSITVTAAGALNVGVTSPNQFNVSDRVLLEGMIVNVTDAISITDALLTIRASDALNFASGVEVEVAGDGAAVFVAPVIMQAGDLSLRAPGGTLSETVVFTQVPGELGSKDFSVKGGEILALSDPGIQSDGEAIVTVTNPTADPFDLLLNWKASDSQDVAVGVFYDETGAANSPYYTAGLNDKTDVPGVTFHYLESHTEVAEGAQQYGHSYASGGNPGIASGDQIDIWVEFRYGSHSDYTSDVASAQGRFLGSADVIGENYFAAALPLGSGSSDSAISDRFGLGRFEFVTGKVADDGTVSYMIDRARQVQTLDPPEDFEQAGGSGALDVGFTELRFLNVSEDVLLPPVDVVVVSSSSANRFVFVGQQTEALEEVYILVEVQRGDAYQEVFYATPQGELTDRFSEAYLSNPLRLFRDYRFPDGVYRLTLRDGDAVPVEILEVEIRQGRPVPTRGDKPNDTPTPDSQRSVPEAIPDAVVPAQGDESPPEPRGDDGVGAGPGRVLEEPLAPTTGGPATAVQDKSNPTLAAEDMAVVTVALANGGHLQRTCQPSPTPTWDRWVARTGWRTWRTMGDLADPETNASSD
ncbi:MAG: hypothetical protein VX346_26760, partial [Planctomycetota bacterium]|nr:hypothetical protein [Planctomycetota bacterium]